MSAAQTTATGRWASPNTLAAPTFAHHCLPMRESNFAFPEENRACVAVSSTLYDRRGSSFLVRRFFQRVGSSAPAALDTSAPLPLCNALRYLAYWTKASQTIRETVLRDGALERLIQLLRDFCISPPPPEDAEAIYGLSAPNAPYSRPDPTLNPRAFDRCAAKHFSLALQCVVNIGRFGAEYARTRVVEAGALQPLGCILEAWMARQRRTPQGPYRLEQVYAVMQLLAVVSEHPRLRQPLFEARVSFHPVSALFKDSAPAVSVAERLTQRSVAHASPSMKAMAGRGQTASPGPAAVEGRQGEPQHKTNMVLLVEQFTSDCFESTSGVLDAVRERACTVMRLACERDRSRGEIRQCANGTIAPVHGTETTLMRFAALCGAWETESLEFQRCKRCSKVKYCSDRCYVRAWKQGHRFWCAPRTDCIVAAPASLPHTARQNDSSHRPPAANAALGVLMLPDAPAPMPEEGRERLAPAAAAAAAAADLLILAGVPPGTPPQEIVHLLEGVVARARGRMGDLGTHARIARPPPAWTTLGPRRGDAAHHLQHRQWHAAAGGNGGSGAGIPAALQPSNFVGIEADVVHGDSR